MRQTKIIATVGPASDSDSVLDALIAAGADIFRLNFSHGTHESHAATFARVRQAAARAKREVAILQLERVPRAQKDITRRARRRGIPVIVATQVLGSMTIEPRPTRAEVNDAANAVEDGVDAIMLAGETAIGAHAARAVQTLDAIIRDAEGGLPPDLQPASESSLHEDHAQALCEEATLLANRGDAQAIVAVTRGGGTARRLSVLRPRAPIFATTDRDDTARRLSLYWGVTPIRTDIGENVSSGVLIGEELVARGLVASGASVVLVSISPDLTRRDANYLKIQRL